MIRGTKEWAVAEINCSLGCPHNCRYCYARYDAVFRRQKLTSEQWTRCTPVPELDPLIYRKYSGQIMFPAAHDIVPENLDDCIALLNELLAHENQILIVTKPRLDCVKELCKELLPTRQQLLFRFTITARDRKILKFWEPGASDYQERLACLRYAFSLGFATSVSVEPMLDSSDVVGMVHEMLPYTTNTIWLGKMNKISRRVHCDSAQERYELDRIIEGQSDVMIKHLYQKLRGIGQIRWKESIKQVVGLELAKEPGLDI